MSFTDKHLQELKREINFSSPSAWDLPGIREALIKELEDLNVEIMYLRTLLDDSEMNATIKKEKIKQLKATLSDCLMRDVEYSSGGNILDHDRILEIIKEK